MNFDPKSFNPPLDPEGDNVFNFTTITIGSGVVLKLSGRTFTTPVYFLATGAVKIDGGIDLNGENGHPATNVASERFPSAPGPGGYPGGIGGRTGSSTPPSAGGGPGGGAAQTAAVGSQAGTFTGSSYLIPLLGGSGGGGGGDAPPCGTTYAGGGGAGGGAIVIASSVSITLNRSVGTDAIYANGGAGACRGSHGSGGAIRLVAPIISGGTEVQTDAVPSGLTRVEAFQQGFGCCVYGARVNSLPFKVLTPVTQGQPAIKVSTISGVAINANPFSFPDITINSSSPVTVNVAAQNIPVGTVPKILIYSEFGPDQTVNCSALQGTLQASTCSASITFPTGGTRGFVKANW